MTTCAVTMTSGGNGSASQRTLREWPGGTFHGYFELSFSASSAFSTHCLSTRRSASSSCAGVRGAHIASTVSPIRARARLHLPRRTGPANCTKRSDPWAAHGSWEWGGAPLFEARLETQRARISRTCEAIYDPAAGSLGLRVELPALDELFDPRPGQSYAPPLHRTGPRST